MDLLTVILAVIVAILTYLLLKKERVLGINNSIEKDNNKIKFVENKDYRKSINNLLDYFPEEVLILDKSKKILFNNKSSKNLFQIKSGENISSILRNPDLLNSIDQSFEGKEFLIKELYVKPKGILSLQKHHHRAEHWLVTKGNPKITLNKDSFIKKPNEHIFIPLEAIHRIQNPGKKPVKIIEAQVGSILKETDIVRFQDIYGRVN